MGRKSRAKRERRLNRRKVSIFIDDFSIAGSNPPPVEIEALKARLRAAIHSDKRSDWRDVSPVDAYVPEGASSSLNDLAERTGVQRPQAGSPRWMCLGGKMLTSDELALMAATPKEE